MRHEPAVAELLATASLPGLGAAEGKRDERLARDGAVWLTGRIGDRITAGRVSTTSGTVFADQAVWQSGGGLFCSPLPGGALAVSDVDSVRVHEPDGSVRWTCRHPEWDVDSGASGSCAGDPSGHLLYAVTPGEREDLCVALDLATGELVTRVVLPSMEGTYTFQHDPADGDEVLLNVAQGQDSAYALKVAFWRGELRHRTVGGIDEPFAGLNVLPDDLLTTATNGDYLRHYRPRDERPDVFPAEAVLPDSLVFDLPGLLDPARVITAGVEYLGGDASRHFVLDAPLTTPYPGTATELRYPFPGRLPPLALSDGTWLTTDGDTIHRWRVA